MATIAGIFDSRQNAEAAFSELQGRAGFRQEDLVLLAPGELSANSDVIPTAESEQPGMGSAIGGVVGGAVGLAAGSIVANLVLPGVGPIIAFGVGAGGLGISGAVLGAAGGGALENQLSGGLPKDELFVYEDALRQCRSVVIGASTSDAVIEQGRAVLERYGAESIDAARDRWWIGMRDSEEEQYDAPAGEFKNHENNYRCGFEAALHPDLRGQSQDAAAAELRRRYPAMCDDKAFRRGFERGRDYYSQRQEDKRRA